MIGIEIELVFKKHLIGYVSATLAFGNNYK